MVPKERKKTFSLVDMCASPTPTADAARLNAALCAWLKLYGGHLGVRLAVEHETGARTAVAPATGLATGAAVARVPDACVLTATASAAAPLLRAAGLLRASPNAWRDSVALALALIAERTRGRASTWAPYVAWLYGGPATPHHPAHWSRREAAVALAGTAAGRRLRRRARHAPGAVDAAAALAVPWLRRVGLARDDVEADDQFRTALAIVSSYAFSLGDDPIILALVPIFDALDTRPGPPRVRLAHTEAECDGDKAPVCGHEHDSACGGHLTMATTVDVAPGAPVFNSYGRLSSGELLRRYGIAPPPHGCPTIDDTLDFTVAAVAAAAAAVADPAPKKRRATLVARAHRARAAALRAGGALRAKKSGAPSRALLAAAAGAAGGPASASRVLQRVAADRVAAVTRPVDKKGVDAQAVLLGARVRAIEAVLARRLAAWVGKRLGSEKWREK